jgi:hypothetical protein
MRSFVAEIKQASPKAILGALPKMMFGVWR